MDWKHFWKKEEKYDIQKSGGKETKVIKLIKESLSLLWSFYLIYFLLLHKLEEDRYIVMAETL